MSSYAWHPQRSQGRYACAGGAIALATFVWLAAWSEPELWPRIVALVFALVAAALLIEQDTRVDTETRTIIRDGRLFGRLRIWLWRIPLNEFTGIATTRQSDPESCDTVFVGLKRHSGRLMAVRYFYAGISQPSLEAERFARELSDVTGLQLLEDESRL